MRVWNLPTPTLRPFILRRNSEFQSCSGYAVNLDLYLSNVSRRITITIKPRTVICCCEHGENMPSFIKMVSYIHTHTQTTPSSPPPPPNHTIALYQDCIKLISRQLSGSSQSAPSNTGSWYQRYFARRSTVTVGARCSIINRNEISVLMGRILEIMSTFWLEDIFFSTLFHLSTMYWQVYSFSQFQNLDHKVSFPLVENEDDHTKLPQ